ELDSIVRAMRNENPVLDALRFLAWFGPMAAALVPVSAIRDAPPPTTRDWLVSMILFGIGLSVLIHRMWVKRRRP
ncbi:MAG TPA: hypothetical protein VG222_19800, partial [Vicinamibacterales bacterium]|nr:hypothetical protein [Vicinamibacterales bacterium]